MCTKTRSATHILLSSHFATGWVHSIISSVTTTTTAAAHREKRTSEMSFCLFPRLGHPYTGTQEATLSYTKTEKNCENRHEYRIESSECSHTCPSLLAFLPAKYQIQTGNIASNALFHYTNKACHSMTVVVELQLVCPMHVIWLLTNDVLPSTCREINNPTDYQMSLALSQFFGFKNQSHCLRKIVFVSFLTDLAQFQVHLLRCCYDAILFESDYIMTHSHKPIWTELFTFAAFSKRWNAKYFMKLQQKHFQHPQLELVSR